MRETEARIEGDMDPFVAARQMDTDEIVELGELRAYLAALVEMAYQDTGYRRIKNPRIWSLHDLARARRRPRDDAPARAHARRARARGRRRAGSAQPGARAGSSRASPRGDLVARRRRDRRARGPRPRRRGSSRRAVAGLVERAPGAALARAPVAYGDVAVRARHRRRRSAAAARGRDAPPTRPRARPGVPRADERPVLRPADARQARVRRRRRRARAPAPPSACSR